MSVKPPHHHEHHLVVGLISPCFVSMAISIVCTRWGPAVRCYFRGWLVWIIPLSEWFHSQVVSDIVLANEFQLLSTPLKSHLASSPTFWGPPRPLRQFRPHLGRLRLARPEPRPSGLRQVRWRPLQPQSGAGGGRCPRGPVPMAMRKKHGRRL